MLVLWKEPTSEVVQLRPTLCDPMNYSIPGSSIHGIFHLEYWSGLPFPSPEDLPNKRSNPALPHCRQTLYSLSYQDSPLPWKESYDKPAFPSLAGRFFTTEPPGKPMTNLDSILKSKDITFPTKICIVKAMIFPVVMYECEHWTTKKQIPGDGGGQRILVGLGLQRGRHDNA